MRCVFVELEYEGTEYHGWQVQPNAVTVQQVLEEVIQRILGERVRIVAAGRTDAGVHAMGQVAHFLTRGTMGRQPFLFAMNSLLPDDIVVRRVGDASPGFHARRSALKKRYEYWIWNRRIPAVFSRRFAWHIKRPLDVEAMELAARNIPGVRDFSSFQASGCNGGDRPVRYVSLVEIDHFPDGYVRIAVEANAFLRHMVRILVGTLVEVGLGRFRGEQVQGILRAKDRRVAGRTAPAKGLFLKWVQYPEGLLPARGNTPMAREPGEFACDVGPSVWDRTGTGTPFQLPHN